MMYQGVQQPIYQLLWPSTDDHHHTVLPGLKLNEGNIGERQIDLKGKAVFVGLSEGAAGRKKRQLLHGLFTGERPLYQWSGDCCNRISQTLWKMDR